MKRPRLVSPPLRPTCARSATRRNMVFFLPCLRSLVDKYGWAVPRGFLLLSLWRILQDASATQKVTSGCRAEQSQPYGSVSSRRCSSHQCGGCPSKTKVACFSHPRPGAARNTQRFHALQQKEWSALRAVGGEQPNKTGFMR
ncbi:hypothetical protein NDU88_001103 [Pleurodeles waltl]|uniref:Secreted protein n=1 Tax=Pleurodeles waltl TaxID=8319 RepID=A0AAV7KSK1_PLEWA|nr:hypothetical protein NDU88_001103 [Pleurodeles waltl]